MVITNQGGGYPTMFSAVKTYTVLQNRIIGCVYKTGTKYASKDGIELAVLKAFREVSPDRGTVLRVRGRGIGPH